MWHACLRHDAAAGKTKCCVWQRNRTQIRYGVAMSEAAPAPADLPNDPTALRALVRELTWTIRRLEEELRLATHKRFGASSEKADPSRRRCRRAAPDCARTQAN